MERSRIWPWEQLGVSACDGCRGHGGGRQRRGGAACEKEPPDKIIMTVSSQMDAWSIRLASRKIRSGSNTPPCARWSRERSRRRDALLSRCEGGRRCEALRPDAAPTAAAAAAATAGSDSVDGGGGRLAYK